MQEGGDQTFIIMVTAGQEIDRLRGFEVGADDYVTDHLL